MNGAVCILAALCILPSNAIVQLPIQRTVSTLVGLTWLENHIFEEYNTVEVSIGTPPQKFNLTLDFEGNYIYVLNKYLKQGMCALSSRRRVFDPRASSSYKPFYNGVDFGEIGYQFYFRDCNDGWRMRLIDPLGVMAYDVVSIGSLTRTVDIAVVNDLSAAVPLAWWPSDGILGFARKHLEFASFDSSVVGLAKGAGAPIVSLFAGDASKNQAGVLTLGGPDPRNCYSNWTRLAQEKANAPTVTGNWNVKVNRLQLGKYTRDVPAVAGFGSQAKTRVPANVLAKIVATTGAEYDFVTDDYVVDCSKLKDLPGLVLSLGSSVNSSSGSFEYRVSASAYVGNVVPRKDKKCTLLLHDVDDDQASSDVVFGWPMHQGHCWVFDYGAKEIAFVKSKN